MNINGTNRNDHLIGSSGADVIDARRGDDFIDGGAGNDVLTGDAGDNDYGRDIFVLREGGGNDIVTDFDIGEDRLLFDFNSYSDVFGPLGYLYDGQEFSDFTGLTHVRVDAVDANADGVIDTMFTVNGADSIVLLGIAPSSLSSGDLMGG